ncbi:hypothetical protein KIPB_002956 [Kipferlia bialata]|uniref:Uncharacterized protein n=1 Tax=Kipferlia bialata TaxID=797122 RepID=A0A9K3GFE6_9EUKA|nr:hypothetical protein KIPB_002956 [Kipferlia bialata]|eukprot:g2956.t1
MSGIPKPSRSVSAFLRLVVKYEKRRARLEEVKKQTKGSHHPDVAVRLWNADRRLRGMRRQIARDRRILDRDISTTFETPERERLWLRQLEEKCYSFAQGRQSHMMDLKYNGVITVWRETDLVPPILYVGVDLDRLDACLDTYCEDMGINEL